MISTFLITRFLLEKTGSYVKRKGFYSAENLKNKFHFQNKKNRSCFFASFPSSNLESAIYVNFIRCISIAYITKCIHKYINMYECTSVVRAFKDFFLKKKTKKPI